MRIKKTEVGFTDNIIIGRYGLIITLDNDGLAVSNVDLVQQSVHYSLIVLKGKHLLKQRYDISDFIKKIKKKNDNINIQIESDGFYQPVGLNNIDNIVFIITPLMKSTGLPLTKRINYKALSWFMEVGAYFKFYIDSIDELDEAEMLINSVGIKKDKVFFVSKENNLEFVITSAIDNNCNVTIDIKDMFKQEEEVIE